MVRDALGQPARVDEDQRRAVFAAISVGDAVVDLAPHLVAGHRAQFVAAELRRPDPSRAGGRYDDVRAVAQEARDRPRSAAPLRKGRCAGGRPPSSALQTLASDSARCEPRLSPRPREFRRRSRCAPSQHLARLLGGEQDEQRLGRGDQDVRRAACPSAAARRLACRPCGRPCGSAQARVLGSAQRPELSASGISRFLWMSLLSALSGET